MMPALTYNDAKSLSCIGDILPLIASRLGGQEAWTAKPADFRDMRVAGVKPSDILWIAGQYKGDVLYQRRYLLWSSDCAARALPIFLQVRPTDSRPARSIRAARRYANNWTDFNRFRCAQEHAFLAMDSLPCGSAAWHAAFAATCHRTEFDAAVAAAMAAGGDYTKALLRESGWQVDRLIARLSENELEDWPLDWQGEAA